jgi:hypothetical protein
VSPAGALYMTDRRISVSVVRLFLFRTHAQPATATSQSVTSIEDIDSDQLGGLDKP